MGRVPEIKIDWLIDWLIIKVTVSASELSQAASSPMILWRGALCWTPLQALPSDLPFARRLMFAFVDKNTHCSQYLSQSQKLTDNLPHAGRTGGFPGRLSCVGMKGLYLINQTNFKRCSWQQFNALVRCQCHSLRRPLAQTGASA